MRLALDTNAYSAWKRGDEQVAALIRGAEEVLMSSVVLGELHYGFRHGERLERDLAELDEFLRCDVVTTLRVGPETADRYGGIAAALRRAGKPIPSNDVWIAAHALEHAATLATRDAHFELVTGLPIVCV